jgi:hypothetical protein
MLDNALAMRRASSCCNSVAPGPRALSTWLFHAAGHSFEGGSLELEGAGGERSMMGECRKAGCPLSFYSEIDTVPSGFCCAATPSLMC